MLNMLIMSAKAMEYDPEEVAQKVAKQFWNLLFEKEKGFDIYELSIDGIYPRSVLDLVVEGYVKAGWAKVKCESMGGPNSGTIMCTKLTVCRNKE